MFLIVNKPKTYNYVGNNFLYFASQNVNQIISNFSNGFETLRKQFYDLELNSVKLHFMTLDFQVQNFDVHYENVIIKNSAEEKILGTTIENKLKFKSHIINICIVPNRKLSALTSG